jgi:hypothetical protein
VFIVEWFCAALLETALEVSRPLNCGFKFPGSTAGFVICSDKELHPAAKCILGKANYPLVAIGGYAKREKPKNGLFLR